MQEGGWFLYRVMDEGAVLTMRGEEEAPQSPFQFAVLSLAMSSLCHALILGRCFLLPMLH